MKLTIKKRKALKLLSDKISSGLLELEMVNRIQNQNEYDNALDSHGLWLYSTADLLGQIFDDDRFAKQFKDVGLILPEEKTFSEKKLYFISNVKNDIESLWLIKMDINKNIYKRDKELELSYDGIINYFKQNIFFAIILIIVAFVIGIGMFFDGIDKIEKKRKVIFSVKEKNEDLTIIDSKVSVSFEKFDFRLWEVKKDFKSFVSVCEYSKNNKNLCVSDYSSIQLFDKDYLKIWSANSQNCFFKFSSDSKFIAIARHLERNRFAILNIQSKIILYTDTVCAKTYSISAIAFSPKNDLLAIGTNQGRLYVYNTNDWKLINKDGLYSKWGTSTADWGSIVNLHFDNSSNNLVISGSFNKLVIFDTKNWNIKKTLNVDCRFLSFSSDNKYLIIDKDRKLVQVYNTTTFDLIDEFDPGKHEITNLAFTPDSRYFGVSQEKGVFKIYEISSFTEKFRYKNKRTRDFTTFDFNSNQEIAIGTFKELHILRLWD
ncbi:MAG: WD40 repeat domain-containing protein [Candidatus Cloacimonetes bacterium]|nr:WD40 repeat domain-containing protein [Candidatus Cloacimonadota bacterium]